MSALEMFGGTLLINSENVLCNARGSAVTQTCFPSEPFASSFSSPSSVVSFSFSSIIFSLFSFGMSLTGLVSSTISFFSETLLESSLVSPPSMASAF